MADVDPRDLEQTEPKEETEAVPFFARFLEDQSRIRTGVKAGVCKATKKHPSDGDDAVTMKYPSDGDDDITTIS